jgi:hypothetical protein
MRIIDAAALSSNDVQPLQSKVDFRDSRVKENMLNVAQAPRFIHLKQSKYDNVSSLAPRAKA